MSKSGSSIQYGWSSPSGTFSSLRRSTGTSGSRSPSTSVSRARVSGWGASLGSSTHTPPTWPVVLAVSRARKAASSPDSCCIRPPRRDPISCLRSTLTPDGSAGNLRARARRQPPRLEVVFDHAGAVFAEVLVLRLHPLHVLFGRPPDLFELRVRGVAARLDQPLEQARLRRVPGGFL